MKKFIFTLVLMMSVTFVSKAVDWYQAYQFAFAEVDNGQYDWGEWEDTNIKICVDDDKDLVTIFSKDKQKYVITGADNDGEEYEDGDGGKQYRFFVVDQDNDEGELRIRIQKNGTLQIYIDFADVAWVYNVKSID